MTDIPQPKRQLSVQCASEPRPGKDSALPQLHQKVGNPVDAVEGYKRAKIMKDDEMREGVSSDSLCDSAAEGTVHQIMSSSLLGKERKRKKMLNFI